ncbi:MAG: Asp-tRNA(Asn)/Glu-tRNA(Gln) amidotransferase subunit GatC [Planctomycetes bacterium]|nr:Asp-tRNA(Asn)/Glu-tRNA(Gln) amidotransferase subunit GatC [Planctomycetota bacterium]
MKNLTPDEIHHIANLARLRFDQNKLTKFSPEFQKILNYIAKLQELNVDKVEPYVWPLEDPLKLREDVSQKLNYAADAVKNAPVKEGDYFIVPRVINE